MVPFGPDAKEVGSDSSKLSAVEDGLITPYVINIGVSHCLNIFIFHLFLKSRKAHQNGQNLACLSSFL